MNIMGELALIFGICLVGEGVAALLPVAFPASVISMVLLMVLLLTGVTFWWPIWPFSFCPPLWGCWSI